MGKKFPNEEMWETSKHYWQFLFPENTARQHCAEV